MNDSKIKKGLKELESKGSKWWHTFKLSDKICTPGMKPTVDQKALSWKLNKINFKNSSVLDIGTWDGGFSFYAENQGASKITSIDVWGAEDGAMQAGEDILLSNTLEAQWASRACFDFAAKVLNSKAKPLVMNVYDISPKKLEKFDIIMFLGVLYHLRHPMLALEKIRAVSKEGSILLVETLISPSPFMLSGGECYMQFFPGGLSGDPTTFCAPTKECLIHLLNSAGFGVNKIISPQEETNRAFCVCNAI